MGLAIVKAILEAHGGGIELASQAGKGTRFTFWLPLAVPFLLQLGFGQPGQEHHMPALALRVSAPAIARMRLFRLSAT